MSHVCPHCGKPINPAKMMGEVKSPRKEAAAKANGERLRRMYANAKKLAAAEPNFVRSGKVAVPGFSPDATPEIAMLRVSAPAADTIPERPATLEGKKAAAMAALAGVSRGAHLAPSLLDSAGGPAMPRAPFDFNDPETGEPHRVVQIGTKLSLQHTGGCAAVHNRYLEPGELEKYWEERIK